MMAAELRRSPLDVARSFCLFWLADLIGRGLWADSMGAPLGAANGAGKGVGRAANAPFIAAPAAPALHCRGL